MKPVGLLLLSFLLTLVSFEPAIACWCRRETEYTEAEFRSAVAKEVHHSSAVFSGEVIEKSQTQVKFRIAKVWKGSVVEEVTLSSEYYVKDKGKLFIDGAYSSFETGMSYLVYADLFESQLQVHECGRTQPLNKATRDIQELDKLSAQAFTQTKAEPVPCTAEKAICDPVKFDEGRYILWHELRDHIERLEGATVTGFLTDNVTEAWIDFTYRGFHFSVNDQMGDYWFFVDNPKCPDEVLEAVLSNCEILLSNEREATRPP